MSLRLCLSVLLLAAACESTSVSGIGDDDDSDEGPSMQVSPAGPLTLGFGQEQSFCVTLLDGGGQPMAGEPVQVSLLGPAHNAVVTPFEFATDAEGKGVVVLRAPETATEMAVRFSSPAAPEDVTVEVSVTSSALGLSVELNYLGARELTLFSAELHDGVGCDQLGTAESPEPVDVQTAAEVPATLLFEGLLADHQYAVLARGYNAAVAVRASACTDGVVSGQAGVEIVVADLPYTLAGMFAISALLETEGKLDGGVETLAGGLEAFAADVPAAILDAIRQQLSDQVAVDQFDAVRADQDLDGLLAQDFEDRGVDIPSDLEGLWSAVGARLASIGLSTSLEIGAVADGVHTLYHTIQRLTFDGIDAPYPVVLQDQGQGTASIAATDPDRLEIAFHSVGLGLGGPLLHVTGAELAAGFGSAELDEVLAGRVDCDAVAGLLAEPLAGLADPVALHAGCAAAMAAAEEALEYRGNLLDTACPQMGFAGSCRLADPGSGDQVEELTGGILSVTWGGAEPFGPMPAAFTGQIE